MGRNRTNEFVEFVKDKKRRVYGALLMADNVVYSYNKLVAYVDRKEQIVIWNNDAAGNSVTTSTHLNAVRGAEHILTGYTFVVLADAELIRAYINQPDKRKSILGLSELKKDGQR